MLHLNGKAHLPKGDIVKARPVPQDAREEGKDPEASLSLWPILRAQRKIVPAHCQSAVTARLPIEAAHVIWYIVEQTTAVILREVSFPQKTFRPMPVI